MALDADGESFKGCIIDAYEPSRLGVYGCLKKIRRSLNLQPFDA